VPILTGTKNWGRPLGRGPGPDSGMNPLRELGVVGGGAGAAGRNDGRRNPGGRGGLGDFAGAVKQTAFVGGKSSGLGTDYCGRAGGGPVMVPGPGGGRPEALFSSGAGAGGGNVCLAGATCGPGRWGARPIMAGGARISVAQGVHGKRTGLRPIVPPAAGARGGGRAGATRRGQGGRRAFFPTGNRGWAWGPALALRGPGAWLGGSFDQSGGGGLPGWA